MYPVGGEIGGVGNQYADGDFNGSVVNAVFNPVRDPADDQADNQAAECQVSQASDAAGKRWRLIPQHHGDSEFQRQQAGSVVYQAFALDQVRDPLGNADTLRNGRSRERIGGRDHGSEHQAELPVEPGKEPVRTLRYSDHSENDQAKSQQQNAEHVVGKFAPGCDPGGRVKKRRQDDEEDDVRIERDLRNSGNEPEQPSGDHENNGIGNLKLSGQRSKRHHEEQQ